MTVDVSAFIETDEFAYPDKVFYPTHIPVSHNQLRQLVSSPSQDVIYFASASTVYRLNTRTRKRTQISQLLFSARCTAAGHGWFCAGGEKRGRFASIRLPDETGLEDIEPQDTRTREEYPTEHTELGELIVNGISIHQISLCGHGDQINTETVALVTNNDQVTRMYSLERNEVVWESHNFGCPMNHATISPDGQLLIVVGDCSVACVFRRLDRPTAQVNGDPGSNCDFPDWKLFRKIDLHTPETATLSTYFTTAWSDNGRLFATASEHGYIMVMETKLIHDADSDPILSIVPSSRAMSSPGAIRAICFAPSPWDLLVWTENYGRICIADLRTDLRIRQVVDLDCASEKLTRHIISDDMRRSDDDFISAQSLDREASYLQAHRSLRDDREMLPASQEPQMGQPFDDGLTEEENQMIGGLRTTRARQNHANPSAEGTRPINPIRASSLREALQMNSQRYRAMHGLSSAESSVQNNPVFRRTSHLGRGGHQRMEVDRWTEETATTDSRPSDGTDAWRTIERAMYRAASGSSGNITRPTHEERPAEEDWLMPELIPALSSSRRASSGRVTLPSFREHLSVLEAERARRRDRAADANLTTRGAAVEARRRMQVVISGSDAGWSELDDGESAQLRPSRLSSANESTQRARMREIGELDTLLGLSLPQPSTGGQGPLYSARQGVYHTTQAEGIVDGDTSDWGIGTTGLAWGRNGRTVFVGTEAGIFEIKLDFQSRKFWPAIGPR